MELFHIEVATMIIGFHRFRVHSVLRLQISRWLGTSKTMQIPVVVFSDTSEEI